jgi:S-adenosylmethionine decarboxylase
LSFVTKSRNALRTTLNNRRLYALGHHVLVSLYGISFHLLDDLSGIRAAFERAVEVCGATVLNRFSHQFHPQGVTIVYALAESHISIHTFPEEGSCAIDVYTCGNMNSVKGMQVLIEHFNPIEVSMQEVKR